MFWGIFGRFWSFWDIFGYFGIGAFWSIASRWGPRGWPPTMPQYPPTSQIQISLAPPPRPKTQPPWSSPASISRTFCPIKLGAYVSPVTHPLFGGRQGGRSILYDIAVYFFTTTPQDDCRSTRAESRAATPAIAATEQQHRRRSVDNVSQIS